MGKFLVYMGDIINRINGYGALAFKAELSLSVYRANGDVEHLGIVSRRLVTDAFAESLIDILQVANTAFSNFKYHDFGTGTTASLATNTALELPTGEAREAGSQLEGATAIIYRTVATHSFAGTFTISEHGVFNAASAGTLLDRSVLSTTVAVVVGDRIKATYELTALSGG